MNQLNDMNKLILIFYLIFVITASCDKDSISPVQIEKFIKYYGGIEADHGSDVKQLPDGGYYIVGTINVGEQTDVFSLITDEFGNSTSDIKTFDGNHLDDKVSRIQLLPDGGAVAVGTYQRSAVNKDIWILRFNNIGDTVWTRKLGKSGNDEGSDLIINHSNQIVAVGFSEIPATEGNYGKQMWMHSIDLDGNNVWQNEKYIGINEDEVANGIIEVNNGYILVGSKNIMNSNRNIFLIKTNDFGIVSNTAKLENVDDVQGEAVTTLSDGNFLILGTRTNVTTNSSDILLVKIDKSFEENAELEVLDEKILDGGENESASCFLYRDNRIHILGTTTEPRTEVSKILLIMTNESGADPQYLKFGLNNESIEGFGMDITTDGGFIFTGSNLTLFKTGKSGDF